VVGQVVEPEVPAALAAPVGGVTQTPATGGPVVDGSLGGTPVAGSTPVQTGSVQAPVVTTQETW